MARPPRQIFSSGSCSDGVQLWRVARGAFGKVDFSAG